jgi:hypothetical protein
MIIRGTTPTLVFDIDTELTLTDIVELWITFRTKLGTRLREKTFTLDQVSLDDTKKTITLPLTQEDTLFFSDSTMQVQIRLRLENGLAYASDIVDTDIGRILKDGVI